VWQCPAYWLQTDGSKIQSYFSPFVDHKYTRLCQNLAVSTRDMRCQKVDSGWLKPQVYFVAICGPNVTKLSKHVWKWSKLTKPLSDWQYHVALQIFAIKSHCEVVWNSEILCFGCQFFGTGSKFSTQFIKYGWPTDMMKKYDNDQPRDLWDLVTK